MKSEIKHNLKSTTIYRNQKGIAYATCPLRRCVTAKIIDNKKDYEAFLVENLRCGDCFVGWSSWISIQEEILYSTVNNFEPNSWLSIFVGGGINPNIQKEVLPLLQELLIKTVTFYPRSKTVI